VRERLFAAVLAATLAAPAGVVPADSISAGAAASDDPVVLLARAARYVRRYVDRAQSIVARERVTLQPLARDLMPSDRARRLEYELRVEWAPGDDGGPAAQILRTLLRVDGRPPRPGDEPGCMDPKAVSPEPLAMFLPEKHQDYAFEFAGTERVDGRTAAMLDFRSVTRGPVETTWKDECVTIEVPGRSTGRVWLDEQTGEVLRLDERLRGLVDVPVPPEQQRFGGSPHLIIERSDTSIRYRRVTFTDPPETILMPRLVESLTVIRHSGVPQLRVRQEFTDYRRFVTSGRIVQGGQ